MALVTTPGAANADAYVSLAAADAYHLARGSTTWAGTDALKEAAIRRATSVIDGRYRARFAGVPTNYRDQSLEWPRAAVLDIYDYPIPDNEIPREVVNATCEAALRELVSPGSLTPDYVTADSIKMETVGPISVEYVGATGAGSVQPVITMIDQILSALFRVQSGLVGRAVRG